MSMVVPGYVHHAVAPGVGESPQERGLVGEDAHLVAVDHVEGEEVVVEKCGRAGTRHDVAGVDVLDVAHRTGELGVDLRLAQSTLVVERHLVHHRVPDRPRELQPVQVDGAVRPQLREVVGATVVLVDQDRGAVGHDQCRVAAGPVGDRGLDVNRHRQPGSDLEFLGVDGADELGEAERLKGALLLARREAGQQDRDVAAQVFAQPRLVVVVAVQMRDVEEIGSLDALAEIVAELVVAGEDEPRPEEGGHEPGVADDRSRFGLDEHAGMADGRGAHAFRLGRPTRTTPARVLRRRADR